MDLEFDSAFLQSSTGRQGYNDLINHWLLFASLRESATMLRLHRSPALRRAWREFKEIEKVNLALILFFIKNKVFLKKSKIIFRMSGMK